MGSDPEINVHQYSQLILNMDTRLIKQKRKVFAAGKAGYSYAKNKNTLIAYIKTNSK